MLQRSEPGQGNSSLQGTHSPSSEQASFAPEHPVLNTPNKITAADFENWVQERGAYFPSKWDEARYTAIFGMNDPGEAPLKSSLLVAQHGKGWFV